MSEATERARVVGANTNFWFDLNNKELIF